MSSRHWRRRGLTKPVDADQLVTVGHNTHFLSYFLEDTALWLTTIFRSQDDWNPSHNPQYTRLLIYIMLVPFFDSGVSQPEKCRALNYVDYTNFAISL